MKTAIIIWVVVILLAILGPQTLYTVDVTQMVVVTRFGEIQDIHRSPGLKVKAPFVDSVNRFDKRVLRLDTPPALLNDRDKQNLVIDAYSRYRITDVRRFFEKLRTLSGAEDRLGSIVSSNLKEEIANSTRLEIIGSQLEDNATGDKVVIGTTTRQEILDKVLEAANKEIGPEGEDLGVRLLDVRIKRADFSQDIQETIFNRMRAERERISRETRALGAEEDLKIRAAVDRERTIILANADKEANLLRGVGEAEAIRIFAEALEQDPEFYAFQRSLEAYKKFLSTNTTVVLSSDADLFQFLQDPEGRTGTGQ
jgi:membrane protease subunit HflC